MPTTRFLLLAGLLSVMSAACSSSTPPAKTPDDKPADKAATALSATEKAADDKAVEKAAADKAPVEAAATESDEDGDCKGKSCIARCDKNARPRDCLEAGEALREGNDGVTANAAGSVKYLDKACSLKEREGCYRLGDLYVAGDEGVPQDAAKAIALHGTACELGRGDACDKLSKRSESGDGVKKDHVKAIAYLAKGCAAEDYQVWTCNAFKKAIEAKDKEAVKAAAAWKKACAAKDAKACTALERLGGK